MKTHLKILHLPALGVLAVLAIAGCGEKRVEETPPQALTKHVIATAEAPAAIGPYSQAIRFGNLLFLAGQIAIDPATNEMSTGQVEEQTRRVLDNLSAVLEAGGMNLGDVVSTTVYLKNLADFARMNAVYGEYFGETPPARATVEVSRLPRDALIEISAIAAK